MHLPRYYWNGKGGHLSDRLVCDTKILKGWDLPAGKSKGGVGGVMVKLGELASPAKQRAKILLLSCGDWL